MNSSYLWIFHFEFELIADPYNPNYVQIGNIETRQPDKQSFMEILFCGDAFENGASFSSQTGLGGVKPNYNHEQSFKVVNVRTVRELTRSSGVLQCSRTLRC